jgi:hypothetical protein
MANVAMKRLHPWRRDSFRRRVDFRPPEGDEKIKKQKGKCLRNDKNLKLKGE